MEKKNPDCKDKKCVTQDPELNRDKRLTITTTIAIKSRDVVAARYNRKIWNLCYIKLVTTKEFVLYVISAEEPAKSKNPVLQVP